MIIKKSILIQYSDALARVKLLREELEKKQRHLDLLCKKDYLVADTITLGKKGKKPLGTVKITGTPVREFERAVRTYEKSQAILEKEEQGLLELITQVEEYITGIEDVKMRNIMTLYYVNGLTWIQVAHRMNEIYPNSQRYYTSDSCRQKHDYFFRKN